MEEPNGTAEPISFDNAAKEGTPSKATTSSEPPFQFFIPIFMLAVIELDFGSKLSYLISAHAPLAYIPSALVMQLILVMAGITYRRIWRTLRSTDSFAIDKQKLLARIGYVVMCLFFALMSYSNYAALVERARR